MLNWFVSNCVCILVKTIQMYHIWFVMFLFAIYTVIDKMIVSFRYSFKREWLSCEQLIDTSFWGKIQGISSLIIRVPKTSIPKHIQINHEYIWWCHFILCLFLKTIKPNVFWNLPFWSNWNDCYAFIRACVMNHVPLLEHVITVELKGVWKTLRICLTFDGYLCNS